VRIELIIATTATSLGFDFIPNPTIVALPDQASTSTSHSAAIPFKNRCKLATSSSSPSTSSPLANTPSTPALVPTQDQEVDDEDDDWEHVTDFAESKRESEHDDGDMIFLGELELEDRIEAAQVVNKGGKARRGKDKTYAAVVGAIATA
jgi:bromodomain-containing protein 8